MTSYLYVHAVQHYHHKRVEDRERGEKQVIDRKSKEREVTESGFPLTFSRNFSRHVCALDVPSFFELFHSGERRNAIARPAKFLWNLSLGPSQVQIRCFLRARLARRSELLF